MGREFPRVVSDAIGGDEPRDTLVPSDARAVRDRLSGAYKGLHAHSPAALNAYALLLSATQHCLAGSLRPICLSLGLSDKQYDHVSEGLNGDGLSGALHAALLVAAPSRGIPAWAEFFDALGYELKPKQPTSPRLTANETGAVISEAAGGLCAEVFRATADGRINATESVRVEKAIDRMESATRELKAHAVAIAKTGGGRQ